MQNNDSFLRADCKQCGKRLKFPRGNGPVCRFTCPQCGAKNEIVLQSAVQSAPTVPTAKPIPTQPAQKPIVLEEPPLLEDLNAGSSSQLPAAAQEAQPVQTGTLLIWLVGGLIGVLLALGVSIAKPALGGIGLAVMGAVGLLLIIALLVMLLFSRKSVQMAAAEHQEQAVAQQRRLASIFRFTLPCLGICLCVILAEAFGPEEGFLRSWFQSEDTPQFVQDKNTDNTPPPKDSEDEDRARKDKPKEPEVPVFVSKPWEHVEFLLAHPSNQVLGFRQLGDASNPIYKLEAKASDIQGQLAKQYAWTNRIPICSSELNLSRQLYSSYEPGTELKSDHSKALHSVFQPYRYVPAKRKANYLSYLDPSAKKMRTAVVLDDSGDKIRISDLIPDVASRKDNLQNPALTEFEGRLINKPKLSRTYSASTLKESGVDLLEYFTYSMLDRLQSSLAQRPGSVESMQPMIYVDVSMDAGDMSALKSELASNRDELQKYLPKYIYEGEEFSASGWGIIAQGFMLYAREKHRQAVSRVARTQVQSEITRLQNEMTRLNRLGQQEKTLAAEIRALLVRCGVRQVDRSERARHLLVSKVSGNNWIRAESSLAMSTQLADATHLLIVNVRPTDTDDLKEYEMEMRLVDVTDGTILWTDVGRRNEKDPTPGAFQLVSLQGDWYQADGSRRAKVSIVEEKTGPLSSTVKLSLVSSSTYSSFELIADRTKEGDKETIKVKSCKLLYIPRLDPTRTVFDVGAELAILDENKLQLKHQIVVGDPRRPSTIKKQPGQAALLTRSTRR